MTAQPEVTMRSDEAMRVLGLARRSVVLSSREVKVLADEVDRLRARAEEARADAVRMAVHVIAIHDDRRGRGCGECPRGQRCTEGADAATVIERWSA